MNCQFRILVAGFFAVLCSFVALDSDAELTSADKFECGAHATRLAPEATPWLKGHWSNGNPRCDPTACKGNMTQTECIQAALSFIACAHWNWDFSACLSQKDGKRYSPDSTHLRKIREDLEEGLSKCPGKCLKKFGQTIANLRQSYYGRHAIHMAQLLKGGASRVAATKVGSKVCCMAGKFGSQVLPKLLGPIGVAYTAGEVGATLIVAGGDIYASSMERSFACNNLAEVTARARRNCERADTDRNEFKRFTNGCDIHFSVLYDRCGPTQLREFTLTGSACDQDNTCENLDYLQGSVDRFTTAAESTLSCLNAVRMKMAYQRSCHRGVTCEPGFD